MKKIDSLAGRIEEIQRDLAILEEPYTIAVRRERGEDPEWETRRDMLISRICSAVVRYKPGDEPHKAVSLISQAGVLALELSAPANIVQQYLEKRRLLTMAQRDLETRDAAARAAEKTSEQMGGRRRMGGI